MADYEQVIGKTEDGRLIVYVEQAGPSSYSQTTELSITVKSLKKVERVLSMGNNAGYNVNPGEVTLSSTYGNTFSVPVRYHYHACPVVCATGWEVTATRDLSGVTFKGIVIGY